MAGVFEAGDIVKYGEMMIKRPPTHAKVRIKAWQSKFFVLRDKTQDSPQRLEYYKDASAFEFHKSAEHCIYLDSIVYIGKTQSSKSHCHPLMVMCSKQGSFTLGCDNEEATADWIRALNKVAVKVGGNGSPEMWQYASTDDSPVNTPEVSRRISHEKSSGVLHNLEEQGSIRKLSRTRTINSSANAGFFVTTRLTPFSEQNNIRGDYMLCISEGQVILKSVDRSVTILTWPVGHLRSYLSEPAKTAGDKDMQLLTLNAGRRSATGEGIFQFLTKHGDTIIDEIRRQSQHAFHSAAQKREAFVRSKSLNGSDPKMSPPSHPSRISRTNTAPAEKLTRILTKKDRIHLAETPKRLHSETDPTADQKSENDSTAVTVNGSPNGSSSSIGPRPRSATDSSVEKPGDDEVFLTQPPPYCEINYGVQEGTDTSEANAYIDLLSDSTAEPIHISDPDHSQKMSNESFTSTSSMASEDGSMHNRSLPRNLSSPRLIPEADETDAEGYIRCGALQTGPGENEHDGNGNVVSALTSENAPENQLSNLFSTKRWSFPSSPNDLTTVKTGGLEISPANSRINRKMREDLVAQIKDPNVETFPPKPKLEREHALKSEDVFSLTQSKTDNEGLNTSIVAAGKVDAAHALLEQARDPESSKKLLHQIIAQMETPLQHDVSELFPAATRKRNSIGAVPSEAVRADHFKSKGASPSKKHSVIEKSKSTCEGFSPRAFSPGPPPIPLRPETLDRRKACLSVGDISEDLHKRPDLINVHRPSSTFFAKGLKSVDPQTLMSPIRANFSASQLGGGGEAAIHARLIQNTEIRDELAHSSAFRAQTVATREDTSTCPIGDGGSAATCAITDEVIFNATDSGDKFRKSTENLYEEVQGDISKRKDSKTSKFVKKVKKFAPKTRRGSNESRENDDDYWGPSERPRRQSLSPGDALDLQGRFTGSETNSPETSPKMKRKNSKTSPKDKRKLSSEEKSKKDKETSASKILRRVTKREPKKDEYNQKTSFKKVLREESPNKDVSDDSISKPLSPKSDASGPEIPRRKSEDENTNKSYENYESIDRIRQSVEQLERLADSESLPSGDIQEPAPAIPPRKKSDPPPLPPRIPRSSPSPKSAASPFHSPPPQHATRHPQPAAPPPREGRRHSSSSTGRRHSSSGQKDDYMPPPPVPPRNTQSPENKKVQSANKVSAARTPVIQLTCSSPENRDDSSERQNSVSDSEDPTTCATSDKFSDSNPPIMSDTHQSPESLSHPIPRRPPKEERRTQAKEYFRTHASQRVCSPSSDSDGGEMEDSDFPPHSPSYGNIEEIRMNAQRNELEGAACRNHSSLEEIHPLTHESDESSCVSASPVEKKSLESLVKSQRGALRLKINLKKESSVDEDVPPGSSNAEAVTEQKKPKRPGTPFSIKKNVFTPASVSINYREPSSERKRLPEPIVESNPPRPSPRPPLSPPSDVTRSPAPVPSSERVRHAGVPVLPIPTGRGFLPLIDEDNSPRKDESVLCGTVTNEGGVLFDENVELICPPGAVDNPLFVSVTLEDPSKYYGQFVLKDLENNVKFGAPIISLEPSGHFFKKPLTLKIVVDMYFNWDDVLILHGSKTSGGKISWQDISHNTNINEANTGLVIKIEHFSIIAILYRLSRATLLCTKDIISRLNLLAFNYTLSVLLKKSSPSLVHDELALLFVSQDVYHEQFYREDDTSSALMQLKKEGFVELHVRCNLDEKSIYNNETLEVIVRLGEDYKLVDSQQENTSFTVHSYDWWHTGKVLRIPLEWSKNVRSLCGKVSVRGYYGHTSESLFSELELCGYVRSLLGVEGAIFNVIPIAKLLEMPEESLNRLTKSQKDENEQLEIVLQHWLKRNNVVEGLAALRKNLESLKQEDYKVTERGQMHIRHLRKVASKILGLQHETAYSQNYFIRTIQNLCKSVFSDCCIELEVTADNVDRAASSTYHAQYLIQSIENHCPALPQDIETKYQEVCSVFEKSTIKTFLIIVPYLIQNIKDIFADERISEVPQNGLRGLPKETLDHFVPSVRNATGNNGFLELLCDACNILEQLCLENYDKEPNAEIEKWGESMAILSLLNYLQPFFQHCCKDVRLYKRLDLFVRCLRKTIAGRDCIDEFFVHDLSNVLTSLIHFAKTDPSKVVRFELNSSTDLPFSCPRETVRYDRLEKTYSQVFRIKRETEDELQLHATARVYIDGGICRKGTFQLMMMLTPSSEKVLNGYITRFHDVTVTKLEDKYSGNLRVFFCTARKEKLLELLDVLRKELRENVVDVTRPEVTWCPLSMRSVVTLKADTVLNLHLVYKWGSEAVVLDSKDFVAYARPSQCVGSSKEPILFDDQLSNAGRYQLGEGRPVGGSNVHTSGDMQIFIRMMDEREITMEVNRSDYIRTVKRYIHRLYQYPSDSQRLVFAGMRLEDNCSLSDYNIQNRSTLHLVQRLRGIASNRHKETDGHGAVRLV